MYPGELGPYNLYTVCVLSRSAKLYSDKSKLNGLVPVGCTVMFVNAVLPGSGSCGVVWSGSCGVVGSGSCGVVGSGSGSDSWGVQGVQEWHEEEQEEEVVGQPDRNLVAEGTKCRYATT